MRSVRKRECWRILLVLMAAMAGMVSTIRSDIIQSVSNRFIFVVDFSLLMNYGTK